MSLPKIALDQDIQPLSEFRKNAAEFIERIKTEKRSIILTQHGKVVPLLLM
ncbi:type II toxin-antitoxin system Phd/YefM family antitoxin [bacterium]|nr:MAG: type II toxin-antitoxin system Phd/YefM family antitoxin [bacterium]